MATASVIWNMPDPKVVLFAAVGSFNPASHMIGIRARLRSRKGEGSGVVTVTVRVARSALAVAVAGAYTPRRADLFAAFVMKLTVSATV